MTRSPGELCAFPTWEDGLAWLMLRMDDASVLRCDGEFPVSIVSASRTMMGNVIRKLPGVFSSADVRLIMSDLAAMGCGGYVSSPSMDAVISKLPHVLVTRTDVVHAADVQAAFVAQQATPSGAVLGFMKLPGFRMKASEDWGCMTLGVENVTEMGKDGKYIVLRDDQGHLIGREGPVPSRSPIMSVPACIRYGTDSREVDGTEYCTLVFEADAEVVNLLNKIRNAHPSIRKA